MSAHEDDACDSVDACVFSGDMLHRPEARAKFIEYLARWQRAVDSTADTQGDRNDSPS